MSPVRVALRVADGPAAAYLVAAADAVLHVPGAEVVLILVTNVGAERAQGAPRLIARMEAVYDWCERLVLRGGPAALAARQHGPWPVGIPVIRGEVRAAQTEVLRIAGAAVLIDLVPGAGDGLPAPQSGRWVLRYAEEVAGRAVPALRRPGPRGAGLAESFLSIERDDSHAFESGVGVSALRRIGFIRDRDAVYWRSSLLPARRLARLVAGEAIASAADAPARRPIKPAARDDAGGLPPFLGLARTILGKAVERVMFRSGWFVLVRTDRAGNELPRDLSGFTPIQAPAGRFTRIRSS